jgi:hypothetical protein
VPTRKQRRRREKTFRHDYDLVVYDEEGNELEVDPAELRKENEKDAPKAKAAQGGKANRRAQRPVPPPTWRRAARRGGIMGAVFFVLMSTLFKAPLPIALVYSVALIPFTYGMDWFTYRTYQRRTGKQG